LRIRRARPTDIPALERLEHELYTEDLVDADEWAYHLANPAHEVWLYEDGRGLLADLLLTARAASTNLRIEGIAVAKRAQGKGYGKRLIDQAKRRAKARGKARITLEVRRDNARAVKVYRDAGFRIVGSLPGYYEDGGDAVRMLYPLRGSSAFG